MKSKLAAPSFALGLLCLAATSPAADWPQYSGPNGDDTSPEKLALKKWPASGPRELWKTELTDGFSSFSVEDGRAFTLVARPIEAVKREVCCVALDANTGKELWAFPVGIAKYDGGGDTGAPDNSGGDGPRSTPSVDGGRVYVMSAQLHLYCLDAATGKELWSVDLLREYHGRNIAWGKRRVALD